MPFGIATVLTNIGRTMLVDRLRNAPSTNAPRFNAMGVGATGAGHTASVTDTSLLTEVETRVSGTETLVTTSVTNDTYQNVATLTASATRSVDEFGLFDAAIVGNMAFSATFNPIILSSGDSIQFTSRIQVI